MNLKILLVSSPLTLQERYGVFSGAGSSQPSFGLACLAAIAQMTSASVQVIDAAAENLSIDQCFKEIIDLQPDLVGISSTTAGIVAAGELAVRIKNFRPKIITAIGGCHVTALPVETLSEFSGFDLAVVGEGEATFRELLDSITKIYDIPDSIPGTAVRQEGSIRLNDKRPLISDLDELPFPAWSRVRGFPYAFRPSPLRVRRYPCASVVLTRGCPNRCLFCDRSVFGNRCRSYSAAYAVEMLKDLAKNYGVKEVLIEDDTFVIARKGVQEFCERLIAEKTDLVWSCLGRADRVNADLLKLMRRAGCWHISYGIESGDPSILAAMGKNLDIEQIESAVRWSKEAGLKTKGFFMVGFPKETMASLEATLDLAQRLSLDDISVMQLTPFPGSDLFGIAGEMGTFEPDWRKMNMLRTVFVPHGLTKKDLDVARARMIRKFYLRPAIIGRKLFQAVANPRLAWSLATSFGAWLKVILRPESQ